jgi:hypothetical protein
MMGDIKENVSDLLDKVKGDAQDEEQPIDLQKLAELIFEKLLQELSIENERTGL